LPFSRNLRDIFNIARYAFGGLFNCPFNIESARGIDGKQKIIYRGSARGEGNRKVVMLAFHSLKFVLFHTRQLRELPQVVIVTEKLFQQFFFFYKHSSEITLTVAMLPYFDFERET
jgi:hypothetical protein